MLDHIKADLKATMSNPLLAFFSNRGFHALLCYRISNFLWLHKIPLIPLIITRFIQILYGIDIDYRSKIDRGCCIIHGVGTVIGIGAVIGKNAKIYHGVTLGVSNSPDSSKDGFPNVGDNVLIGCGAKLLGPIQIGDNVSIGANSVVVQNIQSNMVAVGIPAKPKIKKHINSVV